MKCRILSLILSVFFISNSVLAQKEKSELPQFKYGKVELKEFEIKGSEQDSAAAAVKIFDIGKGSFELSPSGGFVYVFERHTRYKIINKNAYDLADKEIYLYHNNSGGQQKLEFFNGATYNLADNKIIVSKMQKDAKFSSEADKNYTTKKFTLPNVKEGSVIEFSYKTKSDFYFTLDDWYFQGSYPCRYSSFTITIPQYYRYKINAGGYIPINQAPQVNVNQSLYVSSSSTSNGGTVQANAIRSQYYAENIPAIKEERFITTLDDYISRIGFELTSEQFPNSGYKDYTSSWPKIITELMEHEHFGGYIRKNNYPKGFLAGILNSETDATKKMNLIFNYVKNTIKWDGKYNDYTKATTQKSVMEKKSGNSSEINLLLYSLLQETGISSYPVLLSTRGNGAHPGYPMANKFNNLIVEVEIDSTKYLLDATDKNHVSNLVSYQSLNHAGLKVNLSDKTAEWISTENKNLSRSSIFYNLKLDTENKLSGTLFLSSNNYAGLRQRNSYQSSATEQEYLKAYKTDKPGMEISNYKINNLDNPADALEESMDVVIEDHIEDAGNLSYFMPLLFERTKENPFNLEDRKFPVDFAYPNEENYRIVIEYPENYELDKLPKSEKFSLPEGAGSFTILFAREEHRLSILSKITLSKSTFTAEEYYNLKELFKNIVRKQSEQVVFKKS
ncbi:DUF3858 domain-containing protein [Pedobacter sp. AW31-3R]|uniref:DUF3857 domain-containing protein n=1 Tax=Pedobacter sp. AW31-3R TaxID=3445781 RepID=UPI003F9F52F0